MNLIVITSEHKLHKEAQILNKLFEHGLQLLHLRKPNISLEDTKSLLEQINPDYHAKVVLHDHFALTDTFNLKGIHINKRNPNIYGKQSLTHSRSCHTLNELMNASGYDYLFLSPVFDSISKVGYQQRFTTLQLNEAKAKGIINKRVIALGGITSEKIEEVNQYGFGGIAILGALWSDFEKDENINNLLNRFNKLKTKCEEL